MAGFPVVEVASGGIPATNTQNGAPVSVGAAGLPITWVASGGIPLNSGGATPPINAVAPSISRTGAALTASDGTWTGTEPITISRQWTRNGTDIVGATGATYNVPASDAGALFGLVVTASNVAGSANAPATAVYVAPYDGLSVTPEFAIASWGRLLSSYTGPIMRVRRSSDNAELDIGYNADGTLDTAALLAHVGSGDGFVTRLYDQSGFARDPVQATTASQPIVVQAGVLQLPFLFGGRWMRWLGTTFNSGSGALTGHMVIKKPTTVGGFNVCFDGGTAYSAAGGYSNLTPALMRAKTVANDILDGENLMVTAVSDGSTAVPPLYINGVLTPAQTHNSNFFTGGISIGIAGNNTATMNASFHENLLFKAQLGAADLQVISQNGIARIGDMGTYDTDARLLFSRMTVKPSTARKVLINNLIVAAKAHGWWSRIDALCLAGHDSQVSLLNWKSSNFNSSLVGSVSFIPDVGFNTDGATNYIDTGFNPVTAAGLYAQDDASFAMWNRDPATSANSVAGWFDGADGMTLNPRTAADIVSFRVNSSSASTIANTDATGLISIERTAVASVQAYRNGVSLGTAGPTSAALNSATFNIGRITATSFRTAQWSGHVIGGSLGPTMTADMYADILVYMQGIGVSP